MKKLFALVALFASPFVAAAQTCDVTYTLDVDAVVKSGSDPVNVATAVMQIYGIPLADAEDNTRLGKKIINEASKQQDKGGPYVGTYSEMRSCNGGAPVKADGIYVQGVTLAGSTKIADVGLKVGAEINDRYKKRAARGDRFANDHSHAKKIERDSDTKKRKRAPIVASD
jgi:hypothetical protein